MKKRSVWIVRSYDRKIEKVYRNYKNARNFASKLILDKDIMCEICTFDENGNEYQYIGC